MQRVAMGLVCAVALLLLSSTPGVGQVPDHLKCYKIKDPLRLSGYVDLNSPQFGLEPGCKIYPAKLFCVPVTKAVQLATDKATGLPITPEPVPGADPGDRICYRVKCPVAGPAQQQVSDQFGTRIVTEMRPGKGFTASLLCTPAVKGPAPTTTTTTATTTTLPGVVSCGAAAAPQCDGECGVGICCTGQFCTGGPCTCASDAEGVACGNVMGPPLCWGDCPAVAPYCKDVAGTCQCTATP